MKSKLKTLIALILIVIAVSFVFFPALKNGFVNWDDDAYVINNPVIRSLSLENLKQIFSSFSVSHFQPVTILSYLFEFQFFKLDPFGYHLTNLLLHLFNSLLVFWLILMLTGRISVSWVSAILFAIHPLQVQSVAWVSERKNLLYAFFFLGAMISYLYYVRKGRVLKYYYFTLILFVLSLLSKSMAVTMPLVLLILDYFFDKKAGKIRFLEKIPFFVLSLIFGITAILGMRFSGAIRVEGPYNLIYNLMLSSYGIVFYLNKVFLPVKLSCLYPFYDIKNTAVYLYPLIVTIVLFIVIILSARSTKKIIFGSSFFLITILPTLQFIPNGAILVADHYVYLPAVGIFYIISEGLLWLYTRKTRYFRIVQGSLSVIFAATLCILALLTQSRCLAWRDSIALWSDVLSNYPSTVTAYNNRGMVFLEEGEYDKARKDFKDAIKAGYEQRRVLNNEDYFRMDLLYAQINLANVYSATGKKEDAINTLREASGLNANNEMVNLNLATIYHSIGEEDKAEAFYKKAIEINPHYTIAYNNLGILYSGLEREEETKAMFARVIETDPGFLSAYYKLISLYRDAGENEKIISLYKKAIANNLDFFDAYFHIGNLYSDQNKYKEAIALYRKAVKINPRSAEAYTNLGRSYCIVGRYREAVSALNEGAKLNPNSGVVYNNLALSYYYLKKYKLAIENCDKAVELGYDVEPRFLGLLKPYRR